MFVQTRRAINKRPRTQIVAIVIPDAPEVAPRSRAPIRALRDGAGKTREGGEERRRREAGEKVERRVQEYDEARAFSPELSSAKERRWSDR